MGHTLKNKDIALYIDFPLEHYSFSRFDWTGKITSVKFKDKLITTVENLKGVYEGLLGKGLYNEFGIDAALGFEEAEIGEWFHKIGVGLLKKQDRQYEFHKPYAIKPAVFEYTTTKKSVIIQCISANVHGYSYELHKKISILNNGFSIHYRLKNTGSKTIQTNEYTHNFMALDPSQIRHYYTLKFPFELQQDLFDEHVNPEAAVGIGKKEFSFMNAPKEQFFFSNLSGGKKVEASWELHQHQLGIGVRERTDFQTNKINLWGWGHVISPELFHEISIVPGSSTEWTRHYELFEL